MNTHKTSSYQLEDVKISLKLKLALLWTSLMFLIIYLDYFHLYMPGKIDDILKGRVFVFDITQGFLLIALTLIATPALMIFLSVVLPVKINRWTNMITAAVNIPCILFNLAGEAWAHMLAGAFIQVVLLCIIIFYAWKWPRVKI